MISQSRHCDRVTLDRLGTYSKIRTRSRITPELYKIWHQTTHCLFTKMANLRPRYLNKIKSMQCLHVCVIASFYPCPSKFRIIR